MVRFGAGLTAHLIMGSKQLREVKGDSRVFGVESWRGQSHPVLFTELEKIGGGTGFGRDGFRWWDSYHQISKGCCRDLVGYTVVIM